AFISNDMVVTTEFSFDTNWFNGDTYSHDTFDVENFPFVFFTYDECIEMLKSEKIKIVHKVASDGLSELLQDKINQLDEYSYNQYLKYHFYICEKVEMVGHSNHLLFVGTK
ncbi:MAG: class I SAM-dependent methyltransferase, partial [Clostridia bacterium]